MKKDKSDFAFKRIFVSQSPFFDPKLGYWAGQGVWPASWIDHPDRPQQTPSVALFRRRWALQEPATLRFHVSADNRYRLFVDGRPVGRGPERGLPERWHYESYELDLPAGDHVLLAQTWWLGLSAPWAQMSVRPGFLLAAEGKWKDVLSTGPAPWEATLCEGFDFPPIPKKTLGWSAVGNRLRIDGCTFPWGFEAGDTGSWEPAQVVASAFSGDQRDHNQWWVLSPAALPAMQEQPRAIGAVRHVSARGEEEPVLAAEHLANEAGSWQRLAQGNGTAIIPPHVTRRAIIDIGDYCCAYPLLTVSGGRGARIRIDWAEALYTHPTNRIKGNRNEIEGCWFVGIGDEFLPDGGANRVFTTLWWEAGRFMQITVETADEPLTLETLRLQETRYPLEMEGRWSCSVPKTNAIIPVGVRALQMCSHETYMDCPYYEQLMYVGDTRLEALTTHVLTRDDRLPRKAVQIFADSRRLSGFTRSAFPSHTLQIIPPFSLWWVCMAHDYWMWRDTTGWSTSMLPALRGVMDAFRGLIREDGLLGAPPEWDFVDWVPAWPAGIPPEAEFQPSAVINLQAVLAFLAKAEMESGNSEAELATRDRRAAESILTAVRRAFWDEKRGMFADNLSHTRFSEHVQSLAILAGLPTSEETTSLSRVLANPTDDMARATIYFQHYLFEAWYRLGEGARIQERLGLWHDLVDRGLRTTVEKPEPTRSDCHGWGAHPLYHFYASLLGIRPAAPGFGKVRIAPQPGALEFIEGELPHPLGFIRVALKQKGRELHSEISLPDKLTGTFVWKGQSVNLNPGRTVLTL
jgi:hypothetical protein